MSGKKDATPCSSREVQVFHFMLRWTSEHTAANLQLLKDYMRQHADKFVFQAEDTGDNAHYQGYFHAKTKKRPKALAIAANSTLNGVEIRAASTAGKEALAAYCMKQDTRVAGPWGDKKIYMGSDLWPEERFLPWQKQMLLNLRADPDDRTMFWVYDPIGNRGKTKFAKFLVFKEDAVVLGFANSADALNLVSKMPGRKCYVWNLTRAKPASLSELDLYSAMESIKDGLFINTKYETKMVLMDPPHIVVFANHLPKQQHISADRWSIMQIDADTNHLTSVRQILSEHAAMHAASAMPRSFSQASTVPPTPDAAQDPFSFCDDEVSALVAAEEAREGRHDDELDEGRVPDDTENEWAAQDSVNVYEDELGVWN